MLGLAAPCPLDRLQQPLGVRRGAQQERRLDDRVVVVLDMMTALPWRDTTSTAV